MLMSRLPYSDNNYRPRKWLLKERMKPRVLPTHFSHDSHELITRLLSYDPEERPSLADVMNHSWMRTEHNY